LSFWAVLESATCNCLFAAHIRRGVLPWGRQAAIFIAETEAATGADLKQFVKEESTRSLNAASCLRPADHPA
jgi:hypothetical protein